MARTLEVRIAEAVEELCRRDSLMRTFAQYYGTPRLHRGSFDPGRVQGPSTRDAFGFLVETLVYQQLSGSSARAILERLVVATELEFAQIAVLSHDELRQIGLSGPKIRTLKRLCQDVTPEQLEQLELLDDDEVHAFIVGLYGFGEWSADMYLMFHLQRLDVWPIGDLAMRRSVERHLAGGERLVRSDLAGLGERFRPYRSLAAWYFWADDHAHG